MQLLKALWALAGAALCCFLVLVIHAQFLKEGQLAAGTCEIVTLDRDSSQPRRTIARQTARCACRKGQIAGTTRARPACVDGKGPGPGQPSRVTGAASPGSA
uniref:TAFA chemokine like family member 5 n=1 Tax=Sus scrofa TaxID=9823 RepID=A0A8D1BJF3_PIG